jgi:sterol desaturase/sphingolipid hydroxylase (fatty acid hydroxylase superfamily)
VCQEWTDLTTRPALLQHVQGGAMNERSIPAALGLAVFFICLFVLERRFPLRHPATPLWPRVLRNIAIAGLAFVAGLLLVSPVSMALMQWNAQAGAGLLPLLDLPVALEFIAAFLLMDLSFYYWHLANHYLPLLWRFHNVHHIDPDLDVSTAFRFHFGEVIMSTGFRAAQVIVIGLPLWMFLVYEIAFQAHTMFHHSNVRLPIQVERILNVVIVTPRMHGIHHSRIRQETNSNFSVIFSWWDRLHGTIGLNIPQARIIVGMEGYSTPGDQRVGSALALPFIPQRTYWSKPGHVLPHRAAQDIHGTPNKLAS